MWKIQRIFSLSIKKLFLRWQCRSSNTWSPTHRNSYNSLLYLQDWKAVRMPSLDITLKLNLLRRKIEFPPQKHQAYFKYQLFYVRDLVWFQRSVSRRNSRFPLQFVLSSLAIDVWNVAESVFLLIRVRINLRAWSRRRKQTLFFGCFLSKSVFWWM